MAWRQISACGHDQHLVVVCKVHNYSRDLGISEVQEDSRLGRKYPRLVLNTHEKS